MIDTVLIEKLHGECKDLFEEVAHKNHVRVVVHRAVQKGRRWNWNASELVSDSTVDRQEIMPMFAQLAMIDQLRMVAGRKPVFLDEAMNLTGGELRSVGPNLRVNVGIDYMADSLGKSTSRPAVAEFLALSSNTDAPAATDTNSNTTAGTGINWGTNTTTDAAASNARGEINYAGLARAQAAYAHTGSATNYTMTKTFTASATVTSVQACGLFNNATNQLGTLFVENTFTATSLANGDQLTIAWTINIT